MKIPKRIFLRIMMALTALLLDLCFGTATASAAPTVAISAPTADQLVGDSIAIQGTLSSMYALSSVHAQVQTAGADLTFTSTSFNGNLDVSSLPYGPVTLVVTATDAINETGTASVTLARDHAPTLDVVTPNGFGPSATVRLQATCGDPDVYGCVSISAYGMSVNGTSFDQTVTLAETGPVTITFTATDSRGLTTTVTRMGYIPTAPVPNEVGHGDGAILDFDATRILYTTTYALFIRPRGGGPDTIVGPGGINAASLTSHGAIWQGGEWRDGVALTNQATSNFVARGDYAAWTSLGDMTTGPVFVYLRDVGADSTTQVASDGYYIGGPDVAANGDVVFVWAAPGSSTLQIYRYRAGAVSKVSGICPRCRPPAETDGINVAYTGWGPRRRPLFVAPHLLDGCERCGHATRRGGVSEQ